MVLFRTDTPPLCYGPQSLYRTSGRCIPGAYSVSFSTDVAAYRSLAGSVQGPVLIDLADASGFLSLAPLSYALSRTGHDVCVLSSPLQIRNLLKLYDAFGEKDPVLLSFIDAAEAKSRPKGAFRKLFARPAVITGTASGFSYGGKMFPYAASWAKERPYATGLKASRLSKTADKIWREVYRLRRSDTVSISFTLVPAKSKTPLDDHLDGFLIAEAMRKAALPLARSVSLSSSTPRASPLDIPEPVSELSATVSGCEYEKGINEPVFRLYRKMSERLGLSFSASSAVFGVFGEGYHGKHLFGEAFGYPTSDRKSRWQTPGQMLYKFRWSPQAVHEERGPVSRIAFTSTVPAEDFVLTCDIDWKEMTAKDAALKRIMDQSVEIHVEGKDTNLVVAMQDPSGKRRRVMRSDIAVSEPFDREFYRKTGVKTGTMGNLPGGEAFVTPERMDGRFIGDVVISIDDSHTLTAKEPLVVDVKHGFYTVVKGPRQIVSLMRKRKEEAWKRLAEQERRKALPPDLIALKKMNFERVGEFAINTNPSAKRSRYLIINEKMAHMIHIALGSGFEADRSTEYHWDIVIDAKRQKLDIYGLVPRKGGAPVRKYLLRGGRLVV